MNNEPFDREQNGLLWIKEKQFLQGDALQAGFSTRKKGSGLAPYDSLNVAFHVGDAPETVVNNRQLIAERTGISLKKWVASEQVHGARVMKAKASDRGKGALDRESACPEADGIYTGERNVMLISVYADCVPLLFHAPGHGYAGLAHAGWKGTALNIGEIFIRTWKDKESIDPRNVRIVIGPSISKAAYEVDNRVIDAMKQVLPVFAEAPWEERQNGKYLLDMKEMNRLQLVAAGVSPDHIYVSSHCTYKEKYLFFSHRRDGAKTGRMMSWIAMT